MDMARIHSMVASKRQAQAIAREVGFALCAYVRRATRRVVNGWRTQNALALFCLGCERSAEVREECVSRGGMDVVLIQALASALAEADVVGVELALRALRMVVAEVSTSELPLALSLVSVAADVARRRCAVVQAEAEEVEAWRRVRDEAQAVLPMLDSS